MKQWPFTLAVLTLAGLPTVADDGCRYGLQAGLVTGTSDSLKTMTDKNIGFNVGAQATWVYKEGHLFRGRFDYFSFPRHTTEIRSTLNNTNVDDTLTGASGGVDYLYFWGGKEAGLYLTGGVAFHSWKLETKSSGTLNGTETKTRNSPGVAGGVGWQFSRNFAVEVRGTYSQWDTHTSKDNAATTLSVEANWRF